jgi:hypothetical protein
MEWDYEYWLALAVGNGKMQLRTEDIQFYYVQQCKCKFMLFDFTVINLAVCSCYIISKPLVMNFSLKLQLFWYCRPNFIV